MHGVKVKVSEKKTIHLYFFSAIWHSHFISLAVRGGNTEKTAGEGAAFATQDLNSDDDDSDDEEDSEEEEEEEDYSEEEENTKMPKPKTPSKSKKSPPPSSSKKKSKTKPSPSLDDLADAVANMGLESVTFHNAYAFPCLVKEIPLSGREQKVVLDYHIVSLSENSFILDLIGSKVVSLSVVLPEPFLTVDRLTREYNLQGDRDALITSHNEVLEDMERHYGRGQVKVSHPPQLVALPFPCEDDYEHEIIWNIGDDPLYQYLLGIGHNQPHQMLPVLRVTLRGLKKKSHTSAWRPGRVVGGIPGVPAAARGYVPPAAAAAGAAAAARAAAAGGAAPVGGGVPPAPAGGGGVPAGGGVPPAGVNVHANNVLDAQRRQQEMRAAQRNAAAAAAHARGN